MTEHVFEPMRRAMVASQLRTTGVNDPRVVAAMGEVPRERFVPRRAAARSLMPTRWCRSRPAARSIRRWRSAGC